MTITLQRIATYVLLVVLGAALILACGKLQHVSVPAQGEYYYSGYLRNSYALITATVLLIAGLFIGLRTGLKPVISGLALIFIFPLTAVYEATLYRGSHNLIPFELAVYAFFSIPAIAGALAGRFIQTRKGTTHHH
jgi:hypothetical protein